jgi:WD domain, G-beta repeat
LSWEQVRDERAQRLFKLAAYFPEAIPIPLWLLGLAAGLGESCLILNPLWKARADLQKVSLMEVLMGDQVRLHPLVRTFGRGLVAEELDQGKSLLEEAGERLTTECANLKGLENRALRAGYWRCLEQVRAIRLYLEQIAPTRAENVAHLERWLERESHLFAHETWWPERLPGLFSQQIWNRSKALGIAFGQRPSTVPWIECEYTTQSDHPALLRLFEGHSAPISSLVFFSDGRFFLSGGGAEEDFYDGTIRLWDLASGRELRRIEAHPSGVACLALSPDNRFLLSGPGIGGVRRDWDGSIVNNRL